MNILDLALIVILGLFVLDGIYRGFIHTTLSICAVIVSWACGMIFMPLVASVAKGNVALFNMLLYYTEGSEFIGDVELARTSITSLSSSQIKDIVTNSQLPFPFAKEVSQNISRESFSGMGITTLGDYFNQTIVCVVVNILAFLLVFVIAYIVLSIVIRGMDYSLKFPKLSQHNNPISAGFGLVLGIMWLFILFMIVPLILIAMNFDFIHSLLDNSLFAPFFYHLSLLLGIMPGT